MNLRNKKELAAKTLGVGKNRIKLNSERISEIKEAITKQDIKTLYQEGIIKIIPVKGRRKKEKRNTRKGPGKIKMKIQNRKQDYVKLTRKLRRYIKSLKKKGDIDKDSYFKIRTKIKMRTFKNMANLKEYLRNLKEEKIKSGEKNENRQKKKARK